MYEDICVPLGCHNPFHDHHDESRLSKLVDTADPAFHSIAEVLKDMATAGVDFTPEIIDAAVKAGQVRHEREQPIILAPEPKQAAIEGSVVYYVRRSYLIKIGTTVRLHARMNALMPDEVLAIEPGDGQLEQERHRQFRTLQAEPGGEYFYPAPELREHIAGIRAAHGAPPDGLPCLVGASRDWIKPA